MLDMMCVRCTMRDSIMGFQASVPSKEQQHGGKTWDSWNMGSLLLMCLSWFFFFNMESPSVCPWGPCQAEPYSRYSRWHAEWNFRMYSAPARPLTKVPEIHAMHNIYSVHGCLVLYNLFELQKWNVSELNMSREQSCFLTLHLTVQSFTQTGYTDQTCEVFRIYNN